MRRIYVTHFITILYFMLLIVYTDTQFYFYHEYDRCITYILPQRNHTLLSHSTMFFFIHTLYCHSPCIYLLYDFIVFRLVSYHTDVDVAQKGTQLHPEDGIVLPKHVGAIVKRKIKEYRIQCILLVIL
jgi:hypothetical protein